MSEAALAQTANGWLDRLPSRLVSWLLATPLALVLLLHPAAILNDDGSYSHGLVMLVMLGISIGFIHAVGFRPKTLVFKGLFYPITGWLLMLFGYSSWLQWF